MTRCRWIVALLLAAAPAAAFLVQSTQSGNGPVVQITWADDEIPYRIDAAGSDDLGAARSARILRESFAVWQAVEGSRLRFRDEGSSSGRAASRRDRRNLLIFDETGDVLHAPAGSGIIAVTRINSDALTGYILDADIIFNGRDFRFAAEPTPGRILLRDVAVHEIGHFIGLDHTPLAGAPQRRPTMNPFYFNDGPGEAATLAADDATGISVLYPTAAFTATSGAITGRVADIEGTSVFGAHVTAFNLGSGETFSTLSGAETGRLDRGAYALRGLPAGVYRVGIQPVGGGLDESNFSELFTGLDTDFPVEYFGNTDVAASAEPVTVERGTSLSDIDFTTGLIEPGVPYVRSVDGPGNTPDAVGPYETIFDIVNAARVEVVGDVDGLVFTTVAEDLGNGMFRSRIAGQPVGSHIRYRVTSVSDMGVTVEYPLDGQWIEFDVIGLSGSPLAFTVLREAGVLGVFDTGSLTQIAQVDVGDDPIQIIPSLDGRFLYVSNLGSSEITVIETATFRVANRIPVASQPLDMALSPDGATLYVSNSGASVLTAIDVETGRVLDFVTVGALEAGPYGIATAGDRVYVTDLNADQVVVIADGRVVARIPVSGGPRSLATDADGSHLYVTSFSSGDLTIIDTGRDAVAAVIPLPLSGAFAIVIGPGGERAYVTGHDEAVVVVVDLRSREVIDTIPVGAGPRGLSFSPAGNRLFVTTSSSDEIYVFDARSHVPLGTFTAEGGPRGITVIDAPTPVLVSTSVSSAAATPSPWALSEAFPNPFNPETNLALSLPVGADVTVDVYDALGQRLRRIELPGRTSGLHVLSWDGRDDSGRPASSGLYLFVVRWGSPTSPTTATRKALLLR